MNPPINLPDGGAGAAGTADAYAHLLQPVTADDALTLPNFVQLNIKSQPPCPDVAVSMMLNNPGDGLGRYAMASVTMISTAPVTSTNIKKIAYRRETVRSLRHELYRINSSWLNDSPTRPCWPTSRTNGFARCRMTRPATPPRPHWPRPWKSGTLHAPSAITATWPSREPSESAVRWP